MSKTGKIKLLQLVKENWSEKNGLSNEEKLAFLEAVAKFNEYGKSVYREHSLKEITENIIKLSEQASDFTMKESEGSFDSIMVSRHMKSLSEATKLFEKTAKEVATGQQRLEMCYEEIGGILSKYYEIKDLQEAMDKLGQEDADVDNDGDSDESDEYLKNRRDAITKAVKSESVKKK